MARISSVRGSIDTEQLGTTLMHEHVFVLSPEIMQNFPESWGDEEGRVAQAVARLGELKSRGSYIGMDRFGVDVLLPFEARVDTVARMCERGHAGKMVLSHDAACFNDWLPEAALPVVLPNWHYLHIHNDVIPALRERGVTGEQIETMLVTNPRRIFERQGAY